MHATTVMGLFCEDIRQERGGVNSLVGILPDNMSVATQTLPAAASRLALYLRINVDADFDPGPIEMRIVLPSGAEMEMGGVEQRVVDEARANAKRDGNPVAGLISRVMMVPFPITELGRLHVMVRVGDQEFRAASLNIKMADPPKDGVQQDGTTLATLPWPPSVQSPAASQPKDS